MNLTALETALEGDFTFVLHKGRKLSRPRAVTPTHLITMAFDPDLDDAATRALEDMIDAMVSIAGMAANDAYALCSLKLRPAHHPAGRWQQGRACHAAFRPAAADEAGEYSRFLANQAMAVCRA